MRIGFIGLGKMGAPMALNLIGAGHELVVHDIKPSAAKEPCARGAKWATAPAAVAAATELIFTSLPGPGEVEAVAVGPGGLVEGLARDSVYIDTSTVSPQHIQQIAGSIEAVGGYVLDAPVSGGPSGAEAGTLSVMVGGRKDIFDKVRPVLDVLGTNVIHVGELGAGAVAKLAHNAISISTRIAVQEGMVLAVKSGITPSVMLKVLSEGAFGKQTLLTNHIPDLVFKGEFDKPRFSLGLSHKDLTLALALASQTGIQMTMARRAFEEISEALTRGWAEKDNLVTFLLAEERAGVEVREMPQ